MCSDPFGPASERSAAITSGAWLDLFLTKALNVRFPQLSKLSGNKLVPSMAAVGSWAERTAAFRHYALQADGDARPRHPPLAFNPSRQHRSRNGILIY
jgi:hypothetical protein